MKQSALNVDYVHQNVISKQSKMKEDSMENKFGLDKDIIEKLNKIFKKYKEIERVCIFGSRVKGTYKQTSDIDIIMYGEKLTHTINTKVYYDIEDLYLIYKIDLINFNSLSENDKLKENIIKEGVEIYAR